jgi:glyoxylase-like metal-dependent hydrolase (beta-lactamase superfamily II)
MIRSFRTTKSEAKSTMNMSEQENKVQAIKLGHFNVYMIQTNRGYIIVDTGMPNSNEKLDENFQKLGVDPKTIHLIILTHGHLDHVGSTAYVQQISGAKVLCHRSIAQDLAEGRIEPAIPQNFLGRFLNFMTSLSGSKIEAVIPDIAVDDEFDLHEFGVSGKVVHTPGHSPSSVSIVLDTGEALVGDLIREEKPGQLGFGMFYQDRDAILENLIKVISFNPRIVYLSHSDAIDYQKLNDFIKTNQ